MSNLYNNLPPESLKEIYKTQIQPGAVFFLYDEIARKEKFIVILGIDADELIIGTLYINSEINQKVIRSLEEKGLQYKIRASDYEFLHHDSYINASKVTIRDYNYFLQLLTIKNGAYKAAINEKDFDYIRSIMAESKVIPKSEKKKFGLI